MFVTSFSLPNFGGYQDPKVITAVPGIPKQVRNDLESQLSMRED